MMVKIHEFNKMDYPFANLAWLPLPSVQPTSTRGRTELLLWHHSIGTPGSHLVNSLHYGISNALSTYKQIYILEMHSRSPAHNDSTSITIHDLKEYLIYCHNAQYYIALIKKTHFIAK